MDVNEFYYDLHNSVQIALFLRDTTYPLNVQIGYDSINSFNPVLNHLIEKNIYKFADTPTCKNMLSRNNISSVSAIIGYLSNTIYNSAISGCFYSIHHPPRIKKRYTKRLKDP